MSYIPAHCHPRLTRNSGAVLGDGDILTDQWMIEAKTKVTPSDDIVIHSDWFIKTEDAAIQFQKTPLVVISFDNITDYVAVHHNYISPFDGPLFDTHLIPSCAWSTKTIRRTVVEKLIKANSTYSFCYRGESGHMNIRHLVDARWFFSTNGGWGFYDKEGELIE